MIWENNSVLKELKIKPLATWWAVAKTIPQHIKELKIDSLATWWADAKTIETIAGQHRMLVGRQMDNVWSDWQGKPAGLHMDSLLINCGIYYMNSVRFMYLQYVIMT